MFLRNADRTRLLCLVMLLVAILIPTTGLAASYGEAPMLSALVEKGELPPVEERLPKNPLVIEPYEEIGQYGGVLRRSYTGPSDTPNTDRFLRDGFVIWTSDGSKTYPNLLADWDLSTDGRIFTFELREGVKWSDGVPFTTDDVMFWYEDIILNEELTPVVPSYLRPGDEIAVFRKVSDTVFEVEFAVANPMFVEERLVEFDIHAPKHYLKQFHPK